MLLDHQTDLGVGSVEEFRLRLVVVAAADVSAVGVAASFGTGVGAAAEAAVVVEADLAGFEDTAESEVVAG